MNFSYRLGGAIVLPRSWYVAPGTRACKTFTTLGQVISGRDSLREDRSTANQIRTASAAVRLFSGIEDNQAASAQARIERICARSE